MGKFIEKLSKGINDFKLKLSKKSKIVLVVILSLVMLIIFFKSIKAGSLTEAESTKPESTSLPDVDYVTKLENRLEKIISSIEDVGQVEVFVMTETSIKTIYAGDQETKVSGEGTNATSNSTVEIVFEKNGSTSTPVVSVEIYPEVVGVLVVGEGLGDEKRRLMVINAIAVALDIENSKIEVLSGKID